MNHELNLSFFIKKCSFEIENTDELTPDGKKILELEIKPNGPSFEEYKQLLKENTFSVEKNQIISLHLKCIEYVTILNIKGKYNFHFSILIYN